MSRVVLDASAALHVVLATKDAGDLADRLGRASVVMVPELYSAEVANGLCKYVEAGELTCDEALALYDEALALADSFVPDRALGTEALAAAAAQHHPVYDLLYLVLARRHGARVLTRDTRLTNLSMEMGIGVA